MGNDPMFPDESNDPASTCGDQNFSMRDYVLAARKKDISHNWPFPPKYLQMCMECGICKVLPPFDSRGLPKYPTHEGSFSLEPFQEVKVCASAIQNNFMTTIKMESTDEHEKDTCTGAIEYVSEQVCLLSLASGRNEHRRDACLPDSATKFQDFTVNSKMKGTNESVLDDEPLKDSSLCQDMSCQGSDASKGMLPRVLNQQGQNEVHDFIMHDRSVAGSGFNVAVAHQSSDLVHQAQKAGNTFPSTDLSSCKRSRNNRRRKPKKRTMADICARARPSSLEDLDRVNGSDWANDSSLMPYNSCGYRESTYNEIRGSLSTLDESKPQVHCSMKKHRRDEGFKDGYLVVKKRRIMVKNLKRIPKSHEKSELSYNQ